MIVHYFPTDRTSIDGVYLAFAEARSIIRKKLGGDFEESNKTFELGDDQDVSFQRRDIYQNFNGGDNYFFLNYDKNDLLMAVEVHHCEGIQVFDFELHFGQNMDQVVKGLEKYAPLTSKTADGYFFKELQISLMTERQMGGEGHGLGYFYCASDVSHLEK